MTNSHLKIGVEMATNNNKSVTVTTSHLKTGVEPSPKMPCMSIYKR